MPSKLVSGGESGVSNVHALPLKVPSAPSAAMCLQVSPPFLSLEARSAGHTSAGTICLPTCTRFTGYLYCCNVRACLPPHPSDAFSSVPSGEVLGYSSTRPIMSLLMPSILGHGSRL